MNFMTSIFLSTVFFFIVQCSSLLEFGSMLQHFAAEMMLNLCSHAPYLSLLSHDVGGVL